MKTTYRLLVVCCCAGLFFSLSLVAATESIRLESVKTGESYGPFMLSRGVPVVLGEEVFRVESVRGEMVSFGSEPGGHVDGPYEITLGRIVTIGSQLYTIIDIKSHEVSPAPVPAPVVPKPSPQAAEITRSVKSSGAKPARRPRRVRPVTARQPRPIESDIEYRKPAGRSMIDGFGLSVDVGLFEKVDYNRSLTGSIAATDTAISRNSASVAIRTGRLILRGGMVFGSEWDEVISGDGLAFVDADLQNGEGWWASAELRNDLWRSGAWRLDFGIAGSHRRETYDLTYGLWQASGTLVITGTNGTPDTVVQLQQLVPTVSETAFTESLLKLGLVLSRGTPVGSGYLGFDVVVLEDTELDTMIAASGSLYEIELERADPFSITAGVSLKRWGIHWFSELSVIGEDSLRLGAALVF